MNIGTRLKEERERLQLSQEAFAALGQASKRSQVDWEKGVATPNAAFLEALAKHGLDVRYVVTGDRETAVAPPAEQRLLALFRLADPAVQRAVLGALATGDLSANAPTLAHLPRSNTTSMSHLPDLAETVVEIHPGAQVGNVLRAGSGVVNQNGLRITVGGGGQAAAPAVKRVRKPRVDRER